MADTQTQTTSRGPVFLISPIERLRLEVGDTTFWYRRLPTGKRAELIRAHLGSGLVDAPGATALELAIAQYCIRGWDNLLDAHRAPIPFLEEVIEHLPLEVLQRVNELAHESSPQTLVDLWRAQSQATPTPDTVAP